MICFVYEIAKIWPKYILLNNVKSTTFHNFFFQSYSQEITSLSLNFTIDITFIIHRSQQIRLIVSKRSENNIVPLT